MKRKEVFTEKYVNNSWKGSESKSGPGSSLARNRLLINQLNAFIKDKKIKSVLDIGCGDFHWMKTLDFKQLDFYIGIDIVTSLIEDNNKKYEEDNITFVEKDIVNEPLPKCDVAICKDVLFHLSYEEGIKTLENIKKSGCKYFISTTFLDFENHNIETGNWRPINLQGNPYKLGVPYILWGNIEERDDIYKTKSIGVWKINDN